MGTGQKGQKWGVCNSHSNKETEFFAEPLNGHGDFSDDAVTFGPEIARQIEQRRKIEDLEDFRKKQDLGNVGIANDPAAGTRPNLVPPSAEPSWTRRDDPLVDQKDVDKLRKELEEAEKKKSPQ